MSCGPPAVLLWGERTQVLIVFATLIVMENNTSITMECRELFISLRTIENWSISTTPLFLDNVKCSTIVFFHHEEGVKHFASSCGKHYCATLHNRGLGRVRSNRTERLQSQPDRAFDTPVVCTALKADRSRNRFFIALETSVLNKN